MKGYKLTHWTKRYNGNDNNNNNDDDENHNDNNNCNNVTIEE